jgi:Zn-dependent peptidase ImmA (M78 family)
MSIVPTRARWQFARTVADNVTREYNSPPIPVLEIAERSGVNVVFADFAQNREKVAGFCEFKTARLYVNSDDMPERQYFTIAHELGHWLLHREIFLAHPERYPVLPRFQSADRKDPLEQEANHFAANLLVPEKLLKPVKGSPISALASVFKVSRTMMEFRINNVG